MKITESNLKRIIRKQIKEAMGTINYEPLVFLHAGMPGDEPTPLAGYNEKIVSELIDALQWDAGVEASTGQVPVYYKTPFKNNGQPAEAYVLISAYVTFDEKGRYDIEVEQDEGYLVDSTDYIIQDTEVLVNTGEIEMLMRTAMPSEEETRSEFTESRIQRITKNVKKRLKKLNESYFDADNKELFDSGWGLYLAQQIAKALNISIADAKIEAKTVIDNLYCAAKNGDVSYYSVGDELSNVGLDMEQKLVDALTSLVQVYKRPDLDDGEEINTIWW